MSVSVGGTYCKYKRTGKNAECPAAVFKQNESAFVRLQETCICTSLYVFLSSRIIQHVNSAVIV